jgi:hypothetical protein
MVYNNRIISTGFLFEESTKRPVNENWEILNEKRRLSKKSGDKIQAWGN